MAADLDLEALKRVAEAATPGPWSTEHRGPRELDTQLYPSFGECLVLAVNDCPDHPIADASCNHSCRALDEPAHNARHIATFDPPTCLALIARAEAAKARVKALEEIKHRADRAGGNWYGDRATAAIALPSEQGGGDG